MKIAGVALGTPFDAVKASLGQPTSEKRDELTYGGIKFGHSLMQDSRPIVWYILDIIAIIFAAYSLNIMGAR